MTCRFRPSQHFRNQNLQNIWDVNTITFLSVGRCLAKECPTLGQWRELSLSLSFTIVSWLSCRIFYGLQQGFYFLLFVGHVTVDQDAVFWSLRSYYYLLSLNMPACLLSFFSYFAYYISIHNYYLITTEWSNLCKDLLFLGDFVINFGTVCHLNCSLWSLWINLTLITLILGGHSIAPFKNLPRVVIYTKEYHFRVTKHSCHEVCR